MPDDVLAELRAAEAQGERTIMSLLPGDSFVFRGYHTIKQMQWDSSRESVFVTTHPEEGYPKGRTFLLGGLLMFPSFLSDAHFEAEKAKNEDW